MSLPSQVEIGITTKNRWDDLRATLTQIAHIGWGELRIWIFDDGSDRSCPFNVKAICPQAELSRFEESKGLIVRRNQSARAMQAPYFLSLDDDSFPVSGSLAEAVEFAESCADLLCLGFPIFNPVTGQHQLRSLQPTPYRVRSFIGCGHLLRRDRFLELGGYREELVHQGEEWEIAVRAFQHGYHCYHFPGLQIHHTESNHGRSRWRMDYYSARNAVLWNDWYVPSSVRLLKQARSLVGRMVVFAHSPRIGHIQGQVAGFKAIAVYKNYRQPMPLRLYREWKRLPHC